ncbi:glycosyltransferase [Curtobacterium pusillum]|uniref:glycosyltransferase n=1 Tax=Curtobacterium pusillum TaxID=69373 RepID=UPI0037BFD488
MITTVAGDAFVGEAVASVLATLPEHATPVVVFDGAASELPPGDRYQGVEVVCTGRRGGVGRALNIGLRSTRGRFVARLDGDDISKPGRFNRQLEVLQSDPGIIAVATGGDIVDERGEFRSLYPTGPGGDVRSLLVRRNPVIHSSLMVRRSALEEVGGYDETLMRMQDYDLLLRLALLGSIVALPESLVKYRVHGSQNSRIPASALRTLLKLVKRRQSLARYLRDRPLLMQCVLDLAWISAQLLRYAGLRRGGYRKAAGRRVIKRRNG